MPRSCVPLSYPYQHNKDRSRSTSCDYGGCSAVDAMTPDNTIRVRGNFVGMCVDICKLLLVFISYVYNITYYRGVVKSIGKLFLFLFMTECSGENNGSAVETVCVVGELCGSVM